MITPPDFDASKKYPLILEIHGGPFAAYGPNYTTEMQLFADFQVPVMLPPNPIRKLDNSLTASQQRGHAFYTGSRPSDGIDVGPLMGTPQPFQIL